jgi:MoaA/NifB/PqqE/SkfB family radical SAM enzyme
MIGNIYRKPLEAMINDPGLVDMRRAALDGRLYCYESCNLIRKGTPPNEGWDVVADYSGFHELHVNFGETCNIACIMCRQVARRNRDGRMLDVWPLKENIDHSSFRSIVLQGGETLMIPGALEYMDFLASIGKKYIVLTNGTLIGEQMAMRLASGAEVVSISINAASKATHEIVNRGSSWDHVIQGIQHLREKRRELGTDPVINGRMTITVPSLEEIPSFILNHEELGFDQIDFGYDMETVPGFLERNRTFRMRLASEVQTALDARPDSAIKILRLEQLGLAHPGQSRTKDRIMYPHQNRKSQSI